MPPDSPTRTTVPVTVTRIVTYEEIVNGLYPIVDGRSHWEVWWVEGGEFPIPTGTFRLKEEWPQAIEVIFQVDFVDAPASAAAGAPVELLLYNGYTFIGPFQAPLVIRYPPASGNPHAVFDQGCGRFGTYLQYITPTVPFTNTHWLGNNDTVMRTFTITAASSQGWTYTYYYGSPPQQAPGLPFTVEVGPSSGWEPTCLKLSAVYTPTIPVTSTVRETLVLTATSVVSPEVRAEIVSVALAPGYILNEGLPPRVRIYLPLVLRQYP